MIKIKIEKLREKLYKMIESNVKFDDIYEVSVKLDKLILAYYDEIYLGAKLNNNFKR